MTHSEERDNFEKCLFEPTAKLKDSNFFKNINIENFDKLPTKPIHAPDWQVAHGTSFQPNWWKHVSEETMYPKNNPTEFLSETRPQDVCENNKMTDQSFRYCDDELASAQSLCTLKDTKVRIQKTQVRIPPIPKHRNSLVRNTYVKGVGLREISSKI